MSYSSNVKLHCKLDSIPFLELSQTTSLTENGSNSLIDGFWNKALQMSYQGHLSTTSSLSITNAFSIGFVLKSKWLGMAETPSNTVASMKIPVLSKGNFTVIPQSLPLEVGHTTISGHQFLIWEETQASGSNVLCLLLKGATTATVKSTPYSPDVFNHFWITYGSSSATIRINGVSSNASTTGTIPASLDSSSAPLSINENIDGYSYNIAKNQGSIEDLVILNTKVEDNNTLYRVINFGAEYAFNSIYQNVEEVCMGMVFDDPATVKVNAIDSDFSNIYLAKSDGKILKGTRKIWDTEKSFKSPDEAKIMQEKYGIPTNTTYAIDSNGLTIKSVVIKL